MLQGTDNGYPTSRTSVFTSGQKEWAQLGSPGDAGLGSLGITRAAFRTVSEQYAVPLTCADSRVTGQSS